MSDLLNAVNRAAAELEAARARFEAAVLQASAAHSSREVAKVARMSHEGVRKLVAKTQQAGPTEAELVARLAALDARWDALIAKIAPGFEPPDPRKEQLARNTHNGLVKRAESGRRRDGKLNGNVGYRGRRLRTVADETRLLAEREILRSLANHPEDPLTVKINAELVEAREIRERLAQFAEARVGF